MHACTLIKCKGGKFQKALETIKTIKGVKKAFSCSGQFDIVVLIEAPELKSIGETAVKIHSIPGVQTSETLMEVPL